MSFSLQIAGKFINSDEYIYFSDKFGLYFYETLPTAPTAPTAPTDLSLNISDKEFKYISDLEYKNTKLEDDRQFEIYENYLDNIVTTYNLETNNLMLPTEIINNLIETFTNDINNIIEESNTFLAPIGKQLNKVDFSQSVKNDIYRNII